MDTNLKYIENGRMTVQPVPVSGFEHEIFIRAFSIQIAVTKLTVSGRRSVRMEQSDTHNYGFCEISYLEFLRKFSELSDCG
jgi:DUF971 family protein